MTEEFTVDGSFWDGTAVDCEIVLTPTCGIVVDNAWDDFLSHTTFANDEHREVCTRHL